MFKDPFQSEETPYDALGLEPNASPAEVQASLPRFMRDRKNLPRLAIAQQAIRKLKSPAERAQVDIWLYTVEAPSVEEALGLDLPDLQNVSSHPVEELRSDAVSLDPSKEQREFQFKEKPIEELKYYGELSH